MAESPAEGGRPWELPGGGRAVEVPERLTDDPAKCRPNGEDLPTSPVEAFFGAELGRPSSVVIVRKVDTGVVPGVAVVAALRLEARQRRLGRVARSVLHERVGGAVAALATVEERGERGDATRFAEFCQKRPLILVHVVVESRGRMGIAMARVDAV